MSRLLYCAPLQGYTDGIYRKAHALVYGPEGGAADLYFSPFLRVEKGEVRSRDLRDLHTGVAEGVRTIPQIIFKDVEEFSLLTDVLVSEGYRDIDLNLGCPFPPQCHKGRGAAMVGNSYVLEQVRDCINAGSDVGFSIKMRLGLKTNDEWQDTIGIINSMKLTHVTMHPRIASQQYRGEIDGRAFVCFAERLEHPVVFNGDVMTPEDIDNAFMLSDNVAGVMAGRGLLARPSLFAEWRMKGEWPVDKRLESLLRLHKIVFDHYSAVLSGESQILSRLKPFWDYPAEYSEIDRKVAKQIKKATNLAAYVSAVNRL